MSLLRFFLFIMIILFIFSTVTGSFAHADSQQSDRVTQSFGAAAAQISDTFTLALPVHSSGRLKPLDSLARETMLYVTGARSRWGLSPIQMYLGLMTFETARDLPFVEIRDARLRKKLRLSTERRLFSVNELDRLELDAVAGRLLVKEQESKRSLEEHEKNLLEMYHQLDLAKALIGGEHFLSAVDFSRLTDRQPVEAATNSTVEAAQRYLRGLATVSPDGATLARDLETAVRAQELPALFQPALEKMEIEVFYNHARPFAWAAGLYLCLSLILLTRAWRRRPPMIAALFAAAMAVHAAGFAIRVYITGFAPVTNMYGTMMWVSLGVALFSGLLLFLYKNELLVGVLLAGAALILILAESFPLVLSPDLDPVVAVLRSNYWLTIHVLTITISYAAFTICMLAGNLALVRELVYPRDRVFTSAMAHAVYRMIQLGVFLLTAGIILGGIWADYSWGRFWGWDPKETWALIADMGFLVILHARYIGWLSDFGLLAASPVAYLLVVMAWYGVNFILAAGLHSYGFSSGGAAMVTAFVAAQMSLLAVSVAWRLRGNWHARSSELSQ